MKTNTPVLAGVLLSAALVTACHERPAIASPACADLSKMTNSAQKEALIKKCPRSGPDFKPSPKKYW
jgi:entry exclusion lipoprotein TrbK